MEETFRLTNALRFADAKPLNDQLTLCKCYVMALGKNRNRTEISKEAADAAIPSLYNIPVVGHLIKEEGGTYRMGSHDMTLVKDDDGRYTFKWLTVPFGVVPSQDNIHYEDVTEPDGTVSTYMVADVILWTGRYPELSQAAYSDDSYFNESMEINVSSQNKTNDGYTAIKEFQFSALCLLGKSDDPLANQTPCFPSSRVEPYGFTEGDSWTAMFSEFKEALSGLYGADKGAKMEEEKELETKSAEFAEGEVPTGVEPAAEVPVEPAAEPETDTTLEEAAPEAPAQTEESFADEPTSAPGGKHEPETFADEPTSAPGGKHEPLTFAGDLRSEERNAIKQALNAYDVFGGEAMVCYYLMDYDGSYVYAEEDKMENDVFSHQYVRVPYSYADGVATLTMAASEPVRVRYLTDSQIAELDAQTAEFEALKEYKRTKVEDDRQKEYAAILGQFGDLAELDEYKETVQNAMTFACAQDLEDKLYSIRGRNVTPGVKKPLAQTKFPVGGKEEKATSDLAELVQYYSAK